MFKKLGIVILLVRYFPLRSEWECSLAIPLTGLEQWSRSCRTRPWWQRGKRRRRWRCPRSGPACPWTTDWSCKALQNVLKHFTNVSSFNWSRLFLLHSGNKYQTQTKYINGREPLSWGYGRRLVFQRLWVWIPALYTGWTFFHISICCKNL